MSTVESLEPVNLSLTTGSNGSEGMAQEKFQVFQNSTENLAGQTLAEESWKGNFKNMLTLFFFNNVELIACNYPTRA